MKPKGKRLLAGLLAVTMTTSVLFSNAALVSAGGDTLPPRPGEQGYLGENQPTYHGHRAYDVLNWTPETDEYSDFMRAKVPLQERNEAFSATQANPLLSQEVQSLSLTEDYGNEFFNPTQYNDMFSQYLFTFWQYQDYRASWHGTVTNPTPDSLLDPEAPWNERAYEFGVVNIPNPAYTNAAHKNGVQSLGCIFFPRTEHTDDWVYQDENGRFPMADKLVEMAKWYGFDGYFINAEEQLSPSYMPIYEEFCRAMTSQGIYIQVYASNQYGENNQSSWGSINYYQKDATLFSKWIKGKDDETIAANSLYMNPDPSKDMVNGSVNTMTSLGLDPRKTVFNTLEAGQTGFSGQRGSLYNLFDENLVPRTGIANLGAGTVWAHLDEQLFGHSGNNSYNENRRNDPEYQKYVIARERDWWSGSQNGPTYSGGKGTLDWSSLSQEELKQAVLDSTPNPHDTANDPDRAQTQGGAQPWPGMAAFISERSVINGTNFYTNFNTGHGMQYFTNGKVSNDHEWSNINDQDILPTWQWWSETADDSNETLRFDFDYGTKYNPAFELNQIGGYDGSSSLVAKGPLSVEHFLRLYKTKMDVNANSKLDITYYKSTADDVSEMKVGLIFEDAPETVEYVTVPDSGKQSSDWTSAQLDLSAYAGRTLAAFGLAFDPNGENLADYQMNIGEIAITDNQNAPAAPIGLTIDRAFNTTETYISWDLADYDEVQKYNVYAVYEDGREVYMGGTYDDVYYIKDLYDTKGVVTIKVTAEGENGVESEAAEVSRNLDIEAKNLTVEAEDSVLNASWENPAIDYASIRADVTLPYNYAGITDTYTATFEKDAVSGSVNVPVRNGGDFNLRLSYLDAEGNVVSYVDCSGALKDVVCDNYVGEITRSDIGKGWKIQNPEVYDWWHLTAWYNGKVVKNNVTRGVDDLTGLPLQGESGVVEIQLEDFAGNKSEKIAVTYGTPPVITGVIVSPKDAVVEKYGTQKFTATVTGENNPPQTVKWTVGGGSEGTMIDSNGVLTVAGDETAVALTITATSVADETKSASVTVEVSQEPAVVTGITITPEETISFKGGEVQFTASVEGVNCPKTVTWKVDGAKAEGTTIDANGKLVIDAEESAKTLTVIAASTMDGTKTATATVKVEKRAGNMAKDATVLGVSGEMGEAPAAMALDEVVSTKWCEDKATEGWLAVDLGTECVISRWVTIHCSDGNREPAAWNTGKWALEVLKDKNATEEQLADKEYLANDENWTEVELIDNTGDQKGTVDSTLSEAVTGRYFRLRIDQANAGYCPYPAIRLHEFQLFGTEAEADKTALQAAYDANKDRVEEEYTTETWAAFKAALDKAAEVLANEEATQDDIDNAAAELERTAAALVERGNKYDLEALIQYVKDAQQEESYQYLIPAVKVPLEAALAKAEEVMADVDATQETIDNAFNELNKWRDYLAFTGNKTELQALYDLAAALELDAYTDKTAEAVKAAMEAAKAVLDNENALQADIDEAYNALNDAVTGLKQKVDKEALGELIEKAEAIDLSKYLESSQTDFAGALENAKAVFADEDATAKEVYDAYNRLQKAIFDLRLIPDKSLLEDLLNKATEVDESKYTAESYGVLKAAMAEAKVVFEDKEATETEVKAAEAKLENALDGLVLTDAGTETPETPDKENPNTDDSIPYAVPMALVLAAGAILIIRKRAIR